MAVGVERRAKKVASKLDHALLLQPVGNAMSFNSSSQPSGVGLSAPGTTSFHHAESRLEFAPTVPGQTVEPSPPPQHHQSTNKKRRPSKDKTATAIRRSSSTPHMRNLALGNSGELSPTSDKRRNKLGYHRTSVACGHCRRRKIRCLVANDEPTGRCANCIRLKKECNFYPVDQAPETQRSQTGSAKEATAGAPSSSTTSSPLHPHSLSGEKIEEFRPPFTGPVPGNPTARYGVPSDPEMDSNHIPPSSGMPIPPQPAFGYPPGIDPQWPPAPGLLPSSSVAESPSSSSGYWRPSPTTASSAYGSESNVSGGHTPATMSSTSNMSYSGHPDSQSWGPPSFQPPTRSMSYGNIEGLPQQYANHAPGVQHDYHRRTSPYPYPSTIDTSPSTIHASSIGGHTSAPLSAPILPNQQYGYQSPWNPYASGHPPPHDVPISSRSMSGQWYAEPGQLDQVQEEGAPPMAYSHHTMQQYYSGP